MRIIRSTDSGSFVAAERRGKPLIIHRFIKLNDAEVAMVRGNDLNSRVTQRDERPATFQQHELLAPNASQGSRDLLKSCRPGDLFDIPIIDLAEEFRSEDISTAATIEVPSGKIEATLAGPMPAVLALVRLAKEKE